MYETLLALVTGHRPQTLSLIDISNIKREENLIAIHILSRTKTSGVDKKQPMLVLPFYSEKN